MTVMSTGTAKKLVQELGSRFPAHQLMEALGVVYLQYWCLEDCRENFKKYMQVIKKHYYHAKSTNQKRTKSKRKGGTAAALIAIQVCN